MILPAMKSHAQRRRTRGTEAMSDSSSGGGRRRSRRSRPRIRNFMINFGPQHPAGPRDAAGSRDGGEVIARA